MSEPLSSPPPMSRTTAWVLGALGTLLIVAALVLLLIRSTQPEDLTASRARERTQFLQEVSQAEAEAVTQYAWQNKEKGLVRLPVDRALELFVVEWQDPAAGRAELIARVEAATAPPPEPENPYE